MSIHARASSAYAWKPGAWQRYGYCHERLVWAVGAFDPGFLTNTPSPFIRAHRAVTRTPRSASIVSMRLLIAAISVFPSSIFTNTRFQPIINFYIT